MATEISGAPARVREVRYNYGGGWMTEYQVLLLKNGYRYYAEYAAPAGQEEDKAKFGAVLTSVKIDFDTVKENFGRLEQNDYPSLKNKTVTKTSKIYGYAIDMPRLWTPYQGIRNAGRRLSVHRRQIPNRCGSRRFLELYN